MLQQRLVGGWQERLRGGTRAGQVKVVSRMMGDDDADKE